MFKLGEEETYIKTENGVKKAIKTLCLQDIGQNMWGSSASNVIEVMSTNPTNEGVASNFDQTYESKDNSLDQQAGSASETIVAEQTKDISFDSCDANENDTTHLVKLEQQNLSYTVSETNEDEEYNNDDEGNAEEERNEDPGPSTIGTSTQEEKSDDIEEEGKRLDDSDSNTDTEPQYKKRKICIPDTRIFRKSNGKFAKKHIVNNGINLKYTVSKKVTKVCDDGTVKNTYELDESLTYPKKTPKAKTPKKPYDGKYRGKFYNKSGPSIDLKYTAKEENSGSEEADDEDQKIELKPKFPKMRSAATASELKEAFYENCQVCFNDHSDTDDICPFIDCADVVDNNDEFSIGYGMPEQVVLGSSRLHPGRPSLFARDNILQFTRFGPLKGEIVTKDDLATFSMSDIDLEQLWPLHLSGQNPTAIDSYLNTTDLSESNWLRFLLPAPIDIHYKTHNIQRVVIMNEIYFVTTKDVKVGEELFMHAMEPPERIYYNLRVMGSEVAAYRCGLCNSKLLDKREKSIISFTRQTEPFISPLYFVRHYRMEHYLIPGAINFARLYFCVLCNMEFNDGKQLNKHREQAHMLKKKDKHLAMSICPLCQESFPTRRLLILHRLSIHSIKGEGPVECPHCGKMVENEVYLGNHISQNHLQPIDAPPVGCEVCDKTFRTRRLMKSHVRKVHSKSCHKMCDECGKSFQDNYQLRVHQLTHSGVKPFSCDFMSVSDYGECSYSCTTKQWMQKHYKTAHGITDEDMPEIERKILL